MAIYLIEIEKLTEEDISQPQELRWRVFELVNEAESTTSYHPGTYFLLQEGTIHQGDKDTDHSTINKRCADDAVKWLYKHDRDCSGNFYIRPWDANTNYLRP